MRWRSSLRYAVCTFFLQFPLIFFVPSSNHQQKQYYQLSKMLFFLRVIHMQLAFVDLIYFFVSNHNNKSYSDSNTRIIILKEGNHSFKKQNEVGLCKLFLQKWYIVQHHDIIYKYYPSSFCYKKMPPKHFRNQLHQPPIIYSA